MAKPVTLSDVAAAAKVDLSTASRVLRGGGRVSAETRKRILQAAANLGFCWVATRGHDLTALTVAITLENFTSAIGTVMFVAYLSVLCQNPLHTATQYALLTALAAVGRTYLSSGAGFIAESTGWVWFFVICTFAGLPSLLLLWWLQAKGHFKGLERKKA